MKKLSNNQVLVLAGIGLYVIAYKAGKKDAIDLTTKQVKKMEETYQNIGYLRAINDMIELNKRKNDK